MVGGLAPLLLPLLSSAPLPDWAAESAESEEAPTVWAGSMATTSSSSFSCSSSSSSSSFSPSEDIIPLPSLPSSDELSVLIAEEKAEESVSNTNLTPPLLSSTHLALAPNLLGGGMPPDASMVVSRLESFREKARRPFSISPCPLPARHLAWGEDM